MKKLLGYCVLIISLTSAIVVEKSRKKSWSQKWIDKWAVQKTYEILYPWIQYTDVKDTYPPSYRNFCGWETNYADSIYQGGKWKKFSICPPTVPDLHPDDKCRISDSFARSGTKSMRFVLYRTDSNCLYSGDTAHLRVELYNNNSDVTTDAYFAYSEFIPAWRNLMDMQPEVHFQVQQNPVIGSPMFALTVYRGKWYMGSKLYDLYRSMPDTARAFDLGPVTQGEWVDWVVRIKFRYDYTGEWQIYRNGQLCYGKPVTSSFGLQADSSRSIVPMDITGVRTANREANGNQATRPNYFKFGLYVYRWPGTSVAPNWNMQTHKVVYYDDVMVGDSTNALSDFFHSTPGTSTGNTKRNFLNGRVKSGL